ncbi:MAG TPA: peptidase S1, partial [Xanthomonadaceae bacterium]|nr:peptidase S1 [Xanthomonadaceae bacterium]
MKSSVRILVLIAATAAATTAVVAPYVSTAQSPAPAPAPQLVAGLPDFTRLVEEVGPAVVNVEAQIGGGRRSAQQMPDEEEIPEI